MELYFMRHLLHNQRLVRSSIIQRISNLLILLFSSITLVVSKMDSLMVEELLALMKQEITHQFFNEKLAVNQHQFKYMLKTKVQEMLPDNFHPKIGNN